ncbi:uncharacterized protein B0I36DRAFT_389365 [Microdochium trichocladiopsis]|uniref:Uncharacterized protein n=1 Tax=Microdochium trichocladiopsis TaxID=1682393 RepID=A0A9P8XSA6_9PEZI|nr:uncharacterized protein B0I36DRAFT_389365 [Microdochium trichocladiopsis]KAH7014482.1 hypothetical protein B0I36DRAFT_389365 [Microdochium trichocladiopsis]
MVRLSVFAVIFAAVTSVAADGYCQCLFSDGSHCCVTQYGINKNCQERCLNNGSYKHQCNAGGKYSDVSGWNAQFRLSCEDFTIG